MTDFALHDETATPEGSDALLAQSNKAFGQMSRGLFFQGIKNDQ